MQSNELESSTTTTTERINCIKTVKAKQIETNKKQSFESI